jgi:hypothetical protein
MQNNAEAISTSDRIGHYFDQAIASYESALAGYGNVICRRYLIAGATIEFRFASSVLSATIAPPLAHLEIERDGDPSLIVLCWDQESTNVAMPHRPWDASEYLVHGEVPSLNDGEHYFQYDGRNGGVTIADRTRGLATYFLGSVGDLSIWEIAAPMRSLLNWWASERGFFQVHAGAVGHPGGGALLVGRAGAGKSHTALACLGSKLSYLSDDSCLVGDTPAPTVSAVYCSAKVYERDLYKFPLLHPHQQRALRTIDDKLVFFLQQIMPEQLLPGFPLRVILMPRVTGNRDTRLSAASPAQALLALAPENVLRWPTVGREAFKRLADVIRHTPRYYLDAGTDLKQIPDAVDAAIKG